MSQGSKVDAPSDEDDDENLAVVGDLEVGGGRPLHEQFETTGLAGAVAGGAATMRPYSPSSDRDVGGPVQAASMARSAPARSVGPGTPRATARGGKLVASPPHDHPQHPTGAAAAAVGSHRSPGNCYGHHHHRHRVRSTSHGGGGGSSSILGGGSRVEHAATNVSPPSPWQAVPPSLNFDLRSVLSFMWTLAGRRTVLFVGLLTFSIVFDATPSSVVRAMISKPHPDAVAEPSRSSPIPQVPAFSVDHGREISMFPRRDDDGASPDPDVTKEVAPVATEAVRDGGDSRIGGGSETADAATATDTGRNAGRLRGGGRARQPKLAHAREAPGLAAAATAAAVVAAPSSSSSGPVFGTDSVSAPALIPDLHPRERIKSHGQDSYSKTAAVGVTREFKVTENFLLEDLNPLLSPTEGGVVVASSSSGRNGNGGRGGGRKNGSSKGGFAATVLGLGLGLGAAASFAVLLFFGDGSGSGRKKRTTSMLVPLSGVGELAAARRRRYAPCETM